MHAVHSPLGLLLLPGVVPLAEEGRLGVDGQALARRVLQARLVDVEDGDAGAALAREGEGYLAADAWVRVRFLRACGKKEVAGWEGRAPDAAPVTRAAPGKKVMLSFGERYAAYYRKVQLW